MARLDDVHPDVDFSFKYRNNLRTGAGHLHTTCLSAVTGAFNYIRPLSNPGRIVRHASQLCLVQYHGRLDPQAGNLQGVVYSVLRSPSALGWIQDIEYPQISGYATFGLVLDSQVYHYPFIPLKCTVYASFFVTTHNRRSLMLSDKLHHHHHHHHERADTPSPTHTRSNNLGPLTTPFKPPSHCTRAIFGCETCSTAWHAVSCNSSPLGVRDDPSCWPSATGYPRHTEPYYTGLGFYSPGLVCPTGYYHACTAISPSPGQTDIPEIITKGPYDHGGFQYPLVEGETAVGCCPHGYTCATYPGRSWQTCGRAVTSTRLSPDLAGVCGAAGEIRELEINIAGNLEFYAPLIQINWQASDRHLITAALAAANPTATPANISPSTSLPSASSIPTGVAVTQTASLFPSARKPSIHRIHFISLVRPPQAKRQPALLGRS
jgi:hypothetical protein